MIHVPNTAMKRICCSVGSEVLKTTGWPPAPVPWGPARGVWVEEAGSLEIYIPRFTPIG